jgi:hypothetical protein
LADEDRDGKTVTNSGRRVKREEQRMPEASSAMDQMAASTLVQVMSSVSLRNRILATDKAHVLEIRVSMYIQVYLVAHVSTYKNPRQKIPKREYFWPFARLSLPMTGSGRMNTIRSVRMFRAAFENHCVWLSIHLPG